MKIQQIKISKFKNIIGFDLDTSKNDGLTLVIGNNSSGKSNFLEALSDIFYHKYNGTRSKIEFRLNYKTFDNRLVSIDNRSKTTDLPKRVIAVYSGEEQRLWENYYKKLYFEYTESIIKDAAITFPKMLFLNRFYWHISLLCLLKSDAADVIDFVSSNLGITSVESIVFDVETNEDFKNSTILELANDLKEKYSYSLEEFKEAYKNEPDLFLKLYIGFSPDRFKVIKDIKIKFKTGGDDILTITDLSEGQKKQLIIKAALEFAGQEDTLFLFDEPDAHIHVDNKKSIFKIIEPYRKNRHIILTSHSPTLTKLCPNESIVLLENGNIKELASSFEVSKYLVNSNDIYTLLFTDKNILIVEGKSDDKYISKAIKHFKEDFPLLQDIEFLRVGGTDDDNIKCLLDKINISKNQKVIIVVDRDDAGYNVFKKMFPIKPTKKKHKDRKEVCIEKYRNNTYFLMIPHKVPEDQDRVFLVEDYFKREKIIELAKKTIDEKFTNNTPCKDFPNINSLIKSELLPVLSEGCLANEMEDFKVLLNKLNEIILKPSDN